jgi:hypothetical protein
MNFHKFARKWSDIIRDVTTILAVVFAAFLAALLTGGNPNLPLISSALSSHPYASYLTIITGSILLVSFVLLILCDIVMARHCEAA